MNKMTFVGYGVILYRLNEAWQHICVSVLTLGDSNESHKLGWLLVYSENAFKWISLNLANGKPT